MPVFTLLREPKGMSRDLLLATLRRRPVSCVSWMAAWWTPTAAGSTRASRAPPRTRPTSRCAAARRAGRASFERAPSVTGSEHERLRRNHRASPLATA